MFGNALFHPTPSTPGRRHSHLDVSLAPKLSQRRATSPVINVDTMSPGLGYMRGNGPSTPCFVTPTLGGFSGRRFSYGSPIQTMQQLSSAGLPTLNRKAAKRAWAKMSTKKWSRPAKIIMILILTTFAVTLFLVRKSRESTVPVQARSVDEPSCNESAGTCEAWEAHHHNNNPKEEFMGMVSQAEHFHEIEEEKDLWVNRWTMQEDSNLDEATSESETLKASVDSQVNVVEQEPIGLEDLPSKVMDYVESVKSFIGEKMAGSESNNQESIELHEDVASPVQAAPLEVSVVEAVEITPSHVHVLDGATSWHGNDHRHAVYAQAPQVNPVQQQPYVPQQPAGHMQAPRQGVPSNMLQPPPVGQAQPLHPYGHQAPAQYQQQYQQGMPPQQQAGHLRPSQPQVIGVPAHHMPQQQYAHPMPNSGQVLPPGVNPLRYNQYQQPHYNQQPQYHHAQGNIIGHNPPHHQNNQGQKLPPGVNPNHYQGL